MEKDLSAVSLQKRSSGLDILRIVSMCWIIGLHIMFFCGVLDGAEEHYAGLRCSLMWALEILFRSSVNLFGILSGYLYATRPKEKFKSATVFNFILTAVFFSVLILAAFRLFAPDVYAAFDLKLKIKAVFPALKGNYWYITCYIFLFFLMPYINAAIKSFSKKGFQKLLFVLFILLCIVPTFGTKDFFIIEYGHSPFWLAYCYLIGAYLKLYPLPRKKWLRKRAMLLIVIINIIIMLISKYAIHFLTAKILGSPTGENAFLQFVSPFVVINAICVFCIFKDIDLKNRHVNAFLAVFSKAAFGAYILHCHFLINNYVLPGSFGFLLTHNPFLVLLEVIGLCAAVFFACAAVDVGRMYLFRLVRLDKLCRFVGKYVDKIWI